MDRAWLCNTTKSKNMRVLFFSLFSSPDYFSTRSSARKGFRTQVSRRPCPDLPSGSRREQVSSSLSERKKKSSTESTIMMPPHTPPLLLYTTSSLMATSQLQVHYEFLNIFIIFYVQITIPCPCPWRDLIDLLQKVLLL